MKIVITKYMSNFPENSVCREYLGTEVPAECCGGVGISETKSGSGRPAGRRVAAPAPDGRGGGAGTGSVRPMAHFWSVPYLKKFLEFQFSFFQGFLTNRF